MVVTAHPKPPVMLANMFVPHDVAGVVLAVGNDPIPATVNVAAALWNSGHAGVVRDQSIKPTVEPVADQPPS
jgi:hypothetical protein